VKGQFLQIHSSSGKIINANFTLPDINIAESGQYEISYYILMICNQPGCDSSGDSIEFYIDSQSSEFPSAVYTSNNEPQQRWLKKTTILMLDPGKLKVKRLIYLLNIKIS
jgi:hypothetical protein